MNIVLEIALKSVGLLVLSSIVTFMIRRNSATVRHRLWALAFVGLAVLPLLAIRVPEIRIERPVSAARHLSIASRTIASRVPSTVPQTVPTPMEPAPPDSPAFLPTLLIALWMLGVFVTFCRMAIQLFVALRLPRGGEDLAVPPGIVLPPHTRVVRTGKVNVPVTLGFLRPTLLLPAASIHWPEGRLRTVLMHEGAHIQRGDWAWLIFGRFVTCAYWPNPLVYWAASRMRVESELAADESVLLAGIDATEYASTLVDLAENLRGRSFGAVLPFVESGSLKERIAAILKGARSLKPLGRPAAVIALLLTAAIVIPYAAVRMVAGPETIRDGVIDLGEGRHAELVAITEMQGDHAVSWDVHGALLRHPFPINDMDLQFYRFSKPAPAGAVVRYAIFRLDYEDPDSSIVWGSGDSFEEHTYSGLDGSVFQDALGGNYRVMQIVSGRGSQTANLNFKIPGGGWSLYASSNYKNGVMTQELNPMAFIRMTPTMPTQSRGTEASFVLPESFASRESKVQFFPAGTGGTRFVGESDSMTASTPQPPEAITRVEILSRPLKSVVLADLPLQPDPGTVYVPRHFLPDKMVEAPNGMAKLPDSSTLGVYDVSFPGEHVEEWTYDGIHLHLRIPRRYQRFPLSTSNDPSDHGVKVSLQRHPSGTTRPENLYDGEGWPVFRGYNTEISSSDEFDEFYADVNRGLRSLALTTRYATGPLKSIQRYDRSPMNGTIWTFAEKKDWEGALRIAYPAEVTAKLADMEVDIRPLDAKGNVVTRTDGAQSYSSAPGWIEFDLPKARADKVVAIEFWARPYVWVQFPNVSMAPKVGN